MSCSTVSNIYNVHINSDIVFKPTSSIDNITMVTSSLYKNKLQFLDSVGYALNEILMILL